MTNLSAPLHEAQQQVHRAARKASPFVQKFARCGYAAKGVVFVLVGLLAAMAAFGAGGQTTGSEGALETLLRQPFGRVFLVMIAAGLACYSLWQFIRTVEDPEHEGSGSKGIGKRISFFISGVVYLLLVVAATQLMIGSGTASGDDAGTKHSTAKVLSYPLGRFLVGLTGLYVVGYGVYHLYRGVTANLDSQLMLGRLSGATRRSVVWISRFGLGARGVVLGMIGAFLVVAAWHEDAARARGLGGALQTLERQPYGPWLLAIVALGLIAYGIYEFVRARYRRIDADVKRQAIVVVNIDGSTLARFGGGTRGDYAVGQMLRRHANSLAQWGGARFRLTSLIVS